MSGEPKLELKFLGALVEQLGAQMYPSATATIAELISNAWDADARNVWVEMPFGKPWTEDSSIVVLDDGHGITYREADEAYLVVGRKRRKEGNTDQSRGGRPALMRIPVALSKTEMSSNDILGVMGSVVDARDDQVVRQMWEDIDKEAPDAQAEVWKVIHRFGLIDARRNQTIIEARLKAIDELRGYIKDGAREVPTIHEHVKKNTWLLDPRWYLLGDEVRLEDLGIHYEPQEDSSGRLDYLFALRPSKPSTLDEVLVVEIKRARTADGRVRKVNEDELHKFRRYVRSAWNRYRRDRNPPAVSGIMIAEDYTQGARDAIDFETNEHVRMHFRTWGRVISETERLHRGWLAVATKRAEVDGLAE